MSKLPRLPSLSSVPQSATSRATSAREDYIKTKKSLLAEMWEEAETEDRQGSMADYKGGVGLTAKFEFNQTFRKRLRFQQRNRFSQLEDTPALAYLDEVEKHSLSPRSQGVVRPRGKPETFNLRHCSIGDTYAQAFSKGLAHVPFVQTMNLTSNRLSERGLLPVLGALNFSNLQVLNLSNNRLGNCSVATLAERGKRVALQSLDLENTCLTEQHLAVLCKALSSNKTLKTWSLAKNRLANVSSLAKFIESNRSLLTLDLHWNCLRDEEAAQFFQGLAANKRLRELDISWNSLGQCKTSVVVDSLGHCFKTNKALRHLDVSYNYFSQAECEGLGEFLNYNHDLIGIHVIGNRACLTPNGQIEPMPQMTKMRRTQRFARMLGPDQKTSRRSLQNCWVCEKWVEVKFEWVPGKSGDCFEAPIYLHLEFNKFQPEEMTQDDAGVFYLVRAVPPRKLRFFYSAHNQCMFSSEHTIKRYPALKFRAAVNQGQPLLGKFNYIAIPEGPVCNSETGFKQIQPRANTDLQKVKLEKIPWSLSESGFKAYRLDEPDLLSLCLTADLRDNKLSELVPDSEQLAATLQVLKDKYKTIREWYKLLASCSSQNTLSVDHASLTDFLEQCKVFDDNYQQFVSFQLNSSVTLVRPEFMQVLVRIALDKYYRLGTSSTPSEALVLLLDSLEQKFNTGMDDTWRRNVYLTEQTDQLLQVYRPVLETVFKHYAEPGVKPFLTLNAFKQLLQDAGFINDCFSLHEAEQCFRQAMMTQVDELNTTRHLEMSYLEFLEGVVRAAIKANLVLDHRKPRHTQHLLELSLVVRVEAAIPALLKTCPRQTREAFKFPTSDEFTRLMFTIKD